MQFMVKFQNDKVDVAKSLTNSWIAQTQMGVSAFTVKSWILTLLQGAEEDGPEDFSAYSGTVESSGGKIARILAEQAMLARLAIENIDSSLQIIEVLGRVIALLEEREGEPSSQPASL